ncbi:hypothetical protein KQY30_14920 [Streptomyces sp. GMY02]|uniref:hypothetical protein n=1 Tax=Streptomyces sp. GMY02 TaxID=1333528 RepID=UPI001C2BB3E5|nr:hypothetical protein [Streptomyces sp. GMY02]QXE39146.1 hypothetical protein KQY30_14920 [Streptomyces sp. GMY02]
MAFGAEELRVLRRALAVALHPVPLPNEDVRACLRLAESVDEAVREAGRLRDFLMADLVRYRQALPGSLTGYLELLQEALAAGYVPLPDDLTALRALRGNPAAAALLDRCQALAERSVRARLAARVTAAAPVGPAVTAAPAPRTRLRALPGGLSADADSDANTGGNTGSGSGPDSGSDSGSDSNSGSGEPAQPKEPDRKPDEKPGKEPDKESGKEPAEPAKPPRKPGPPQRPAPGKPMPKPSEVFPPRRRPAPPPEKLAVG